MSNHSPAEIQAYIDEHYLTLDALADRAGITPERVLELQAAQCIPVHSYEVRRTHTFTSTFGDHSVCEEPQRYYHPSVLEWLETAIERAERSPLGEVAARFRSDFAGDFDAALEGRQAPWPGGVDYAWAYLMDGTWGLCLKDITMEALLKKEYARQTIRGIAERAAASEPDDEERHALRGAIADYREAVLPFAPHEVDRSSNRTEIEPVCNRLGI